MKRFTETEKWKDPWFRSLPTTYKAFWLYLCDECDSAGFWDPDMGLASFMVGASLDLQEALKHLGSRIEVTESGKWLLVKFSQFQYGMLSPSNPCHRGVLRVFEQRGYQAPSKDHTRPARKGKGKGIGIGIGKEGVQGEPTSDDNGDTEAPVTLPVSPNDESLIAFNLFWDAYPNKKSRSDAEHAWVEVDAIKFTKEIMTAIDVQKKSEDWQKENGKYIPYPARWLRDGRWMDSPACVIESKPENRAEYEKRILMEAIQ